MKTFVRWPQWRLVTSNACFSICSRVCGFCSLPVVFQRRHRSRSPLQLFAVYFHYHRQPQARFYRLTFNLRHLLFCYFFCYSCLLWIAADKSDCDSVIFSLITSQAKRLELREKKKPERPTFIVFSAQLFITSRTAAATTILLLWEY